jgi:hypothetical protein
MAKRVAVVFACLALGAACEKPQGSLAGSFTVRVSPDPVVFRQLYPRATSIVHASPPPFLPSYYAATMTLVITEGRGGVGHLDSVQTELVSRDGVTTHAGTYDGGCDYENEFTGAGNRTIPPHGRLEWCLSRVATPDLAREYTLRVTPRITDELGNAIAPSESLTVVVQR